MLKYSKRIFNLKVLHSGIFIYFISKFLFSAHHWVGRWRGGRRSTVDGRRATLWPKVSLQVGNVIETLEGAGVVLGGIWRPYKRQLNAISLWQISFVWQMGGVAMQIANKKNSLKVYATNFGTRPRLSLPRPTAIQFGPGQLQLVRAKMVDGKRGFCRWLHLYFSKGGVRRGWLLFFGCCSTVSKASLWKNYQWPSSLHW